MHEINDVGLFIEEWNNMAAYKDETIHGVYIFTHGHDRAIWFGSGNNAISVDGYNRAGENVLRSLSELNVANIHGSVHLFSCNSGHLATYYSIKGDGHNFASALSLKISGNSSVIGYDGNVGFGPGGIFNSITGDWKPRLSHSQDSFYTILELREASKRKPRGAQQYINGQLNNFFMPGGYIKAAP